MKELYWRRVSLLAIVLIAASARHASAQPAGSVAGLDRTRFELFCPNAITQNFPTSGPTVTTWMICWHEVAGNDSIANPNGLAIGPVYFRQSLAAPFVRILWDMRVSDYFVPYHAGSPRFYDLSGFNFVLTGVTASDCPASVGGAPISPHVCKEVHDRGLMWKDFASVRRGEELVLWGAIDAANYRYIQEYTFRDDGVIIGRVGATGQNLPGDELEPHVHNALWRLDIDLNGVTNNAARLQHIENPANPAGTATDTTTPIGTAQGFTWSARTHDMVEVTNPSFKNSQGHISAYDLLPLVTGGGLTQHYEKFTQNEFWVTPYNAAQFAARNLPTYVTGAPSVANRDIVVWYKGSLHHHPRDEDGVYNSSHVWVGTADVMWTGFMLMPHNFFDCSPFYKPCP
jgi:hypothetical protein